MTNPDERRKVAQEVVEMMAGHMPDLREQLATRLFDVVWAARHRQMDPNTKYCDAQFTEYKDLADECIRQMEWVRACDSKGEHWVGDGRDGTRHLVDAIELPLTAAPDDWTPNSENT